VLCCRNFTDTALGISLVILNSMVDLVSFSGILYSIYPPLFAALLAYSIGGTVGSVWLGKVRPTKFRLGRRLCCVHLTAGVGDWLSQSMGGGGQVTLAGWTAPAAHVVFVHVTAMCNSKSP
jgi:hypothetical protein